MCRNRIVIFLAGCLVFNIWAQDEAERTPPTDEERAARRAMMQERGGGRRPGQLSDQANGQAMGSRRSPPEGGELATGQQADASSDVAVNWENITLKDCIEVLCRDLGMEFIISPSVNVAQEVSVRAGDVTKWAKEDKLELFDAVLETAGVQKVERGRIWVFSPSDIRPVVEGYTDSEYSDGKPIIGVIRLKDVDASQAAEFLNTVGGKPQRVFAVSGSRMILVLGTQVYLTQMEKLVQLIDFPAGLLKPYALTSASSDDVAEELTSLFYGRIGGDGTSVRFVSVSRLNTVVAHNVPESMVSELDQWVELLDRADEGNSRMTKVYRLQVISAEVIATTLNDLYSSLYEQQQDAQELKTSQAKTSAKTTTTKTTNNSKTTNNKNNKTSTAKTTGTAAAKNSAAAPGVSPEMDEEAIILSDEDTNTLIVNATPEQHRDIEKTINELDQSRKQVLIETSLVEVTLDASLDLGLEWTYASGKNSAQVGNSDFTDIDMASDGLTYLFTSSSSKMAMIHMAETDDRLQVLSSPTVLTRDGMEASVSFGQEVPVQESSISESGTENYTYDYRDATITLTVTPVIDDNRLVTLDLEQTFREVDPDYDETATGEDYIAPTFTTRSLKSNLQVEDGQTLVLGGLIKRGDQKIQTGIPVLCKLPVLGWMFGSTQVDKIGSEILVIITPHVIDTREESDLMTREYREKVFGSLDVEDVRSLYDLGVESEDQSEEE